MAALFHTGLKKFKYPYKHDKDQKVYYSQGWRPNVRVNSKEYLINDLMVPTVSNGFYYLCVDPGISAPTEPTLASTIDEITLDGTVEWKAVPYELMLNAGDTIDSSSWFSNLAVTIDNQGFNQGITWCRVTALPTDTVVFELTNRVDITRADGKQESYDRTLIIVVQQL